MNAQWRAALSWAGLAAGGGAWGLSTQLNYALVPVTCGKGVAITVAIAAALIVVSVIGAVFSYRAARVRAVAEWTDASGGVPHRFIAWVSFGAGILFALVIANQAVAMLILGGCLR